MSFMERPLPGWNGFVGKMGDNREFHLEHVQIEMSASSKKLAV